MCVPGVCFVLLVLTVLSEFYSTAISFDFPPANDDSLEIFEIKFFSSLAFYSHNFVPSIISDNKVDNIGPII